MYQKINEDSEIFDFLQEATLDGIWYWDLEDLEHEWMSPKFWKTFGYDPKEKKHAASEWQSLVHKKDLSLVKDNFNRHLKDPKHPFDQVIRYRHRNGTTIWVRCRGFAIRDNDGKPIRMLGAHMNVTKLMKSQHEMNRLKNEYEKVFNGTQDALFLIKVKDKRQFQFIRNNQSHQKITGISQSMIAGKTPYELLGREAGEAVVDHYQNCVDKETTVTYEESLELPSGKRLWNTTLTPIFSDNKVTHIVGSAVDITEQRALENELVRRANYDALTGLANRDFLTNKIEECTQNLNKKFVFLFIDLDGFKEINDSYGHAIGDQVLKEVANRLKHSIDTDDFVARLGGDEFVIIKCDLYNLDAIDGFKESILKTLTKPIYHEGKTLHINASIGFSRFPQDGLDYDQLAHHADRAMYVMKEKQ